MKNPLVPYDGSANAQRALTHTLNELRDREGAQLHLLNVHMPPVHTWPGKLVSPDMIESEFRLESMRLLAPAEALAKAAGMACTAHVSIGLAAEEIVACAEQQGCDAIVMGTRGLGAVSGLVLGSVAQKLVHLAPVALTLVK